jgi:hypothetical protein
MTTRPGTTPEPAWWLCPNAPRCGHGAVLHDIYDLEDTVPRCCVDGCDCGKPLAAVAGGRDAADLASAPHEGGDPNHAGRSAT